MRTVQTIRVAAIILCFICPRRGYAEPMSVCSPRDVGMSQEKLSQISVVEGKRLLRAETVEMMTKNQLPGFTIRKEFEYEVQYNEQQDTSNIIISSGCGDDAVVRPGHWSE